METNLLKFKYGEKGFTLVETLIAIAILLLAITGPLVLGANSLTTALYAKDQVTAFYLAEEGVEYIRSIRDDDTLNGREWNNGPLTKWAVTNCRKDAPCGLDPYAIFNGASSVLSSCASVDICPIFFDKTYGIYRQVLSSSSSFTPTNFNRTISIETVSPEENKITVNVSWKTGYIQSPHNFQIIEYITNWPGTL